MNRVVAIREVGSDTGGAPPEPALCEEDGRAAAAEVLETYFRRADSTRWNISIV